MTGRTFVRKPFHLRYNKNRKLPSHLFSKEKTEKITLKMKKDGKILLVSRPAAAKQAHNASHLI
jgi:hypothetical protein